MPEKNLPVAGADDMTLLDEIRQRPDVAFWLSREPLTLQSADPDDPDQRPRTRIQLLKGGLYSHPWWDLLRFDRALMEQLKENFDKGVIGQQVPVDCDHFEENRANGWFEDVILEVVNPNVEAEDDLTANLYADIRLTSLGAENIREEFYKYTSIAFWPNFKDNQGRLWGPAIVGTAFTNTPYVTGMDELTLNRADHPDYFSGKHSRNARALTPAPEDDVSGKPVTLNEPDPGTVPAAGAPNQPRTAAHRRNWSMLLSEVLKAALKRVGLSGAEDTDEARERAILSQVRKDLDLSVDVISDEILATVINSTYDTMKAAVDSEEETTDPKTTPEPVTAAEPAPVVETPDAGGDPVVTAVNAAMGDLRSSLEGRLLTMESAIQGQKATIDDLGGRITATDAEKSAAEFELRFANLVHERRAVPAQKDTLRRMYDLDREIFDDHVKTLQPRSELAGPVGTDAVDAEGEFSGTETRFHVEVHRLEKDEGLDPKAAYLRAKAEKPDLFREHVQLTGIGKKALDNRRRRAAREFTRV